ncbi:restriction endonuclease subunit S [Escherichia coli]|uniref:restriction endonuclease subunit S n=1 Tax=Escherichia coli TaxID=562 RepID=UPI000DA47B87|nr:restriction endonuclease subunit S [Escherichia coli]EEW0712689.1 restriction endonuclease subunit S [Escherichia coli]MEA0038655.1 restriction endonuclease subunit S [Escherichia coli]SQJ79378.1 putative restriction-modification DNA specificity domain protein [Escherichia coli]
MKLKPGWRHVKLSDIAKIKSGSTPLRAEGERYFSTAGTPWVKTLDLNNGEIISTDEKITDTALLETSCSVFPVGTVLVAMYGGFNQIGRTGLLTIPAAINQALSGLILDRDKAEPAYILNYLNGNVKLWKKFAASSRKDPNITRDDVCGFPVLLPPLTEQKKIAKILSTWDNAISVTEKLLANSQQQKKALMQQLLTGQKRLLDENGVRFSGEWVYLTFDNAFIVANKKSTQVKSSDYLQSGSIPIIDQGQSRIAGYCNNLEVYSDVPVIVFGDHTRCVKWIEFVFCPGADGTQVIKTSKILEPKLGYYLLSNTDIPNLGYSRHMRELKEKDFRLPLDIKEQQKIAAVLSAADAEISTLEKKLACLRDEKKALMQQLLTGKRRVKVDEAVAE